MTKKKIETIFAQIGNRSESATGTISAPIYLSTAYRHEGIGLSTGYDYSRTGNPTRKILEDAIAELEGGDGGFAFSSGMAAIYTLLSLFKSGDEIIVSQDIYGGSFRLFGDAEKQWGIKFKYWDSSSTLQLEDFITKYTKAVFLETPTNPLMQEANISAISEITKKHQLLLIVDNTFYTPLLQQPIGLGADIVVHSATKYLGGHNDVLAGLIIAKGSQLCEAIAYYQNSCGAVLSPFDSWLVIRGMKTLPLRMQQHEKNTKAICTFLENHPDITDVLYPGRGGMLSFRLLHEDFINPFLQSLKLISFAESLGGVESFITYPTTQTHAAIPEETRLKGGLCNRLLRFSVGIENYEDLIADLEQALSKMKGGK